MTQSNAPATGRKPRTPAAAAAPAAVRAPAAKPAAAAAPEKTAPEGLDDLIEDGEEGAAETPAATEAPTPPVDEENKPKTRKQAAKEAEEAKLANKAKKEGPKVVPTDDFIRDKKGNIKVDADGDKERYAPGPHKGVGYVNENGVLFPVHFKFKGGHVGTFGNVILNKCPECHTANGIDQARVGICGNQKCNYNQVVALEEYELE